MKAHGEYRHQLYRQGVMMSGGPFTDSSGGAAVVMAEHGDEARAIAAADPAVVAGVFTADIRPWYAVNWETYGHSDTT